MKKYSIRIGALVLLLGVSTRWTTQAATLAQIERHEIGITLDVPAHTTTVRDQGLMLVSKGWNLLYVNQNAILESLTVAGSSVQRLVIAPKDTSGLPPEIRSALPKEEIPPQSKLVFFKVRKAADSADFMISFKAIYNQDVKEVKFSREAIGSEVSGTISEQGAYLSSAGLYYPQGAEKSSRFAVTADIPADWSSVADGNRKSVESKGNRKIESWENPFVSDGCTFMAAPYAVKSVTVDSVEILCYFFAADTGLADNYLKACANYVTMYSGLIGPYPFRRFTVAENFFPTGYGMPAWTLLGQTVLRLPFIITSSLGHEVLHNWWGNSIYVDYDRGNWCEGATVYGADYHYKLAESPAAARQYRKDILKEYLSYVSQDKDFPLRDFKSRTSPSTRAVGYNKAMMVFHMIEEEIGTTAFFDAWKLVYQQDLGKKIAWEDWIGAFQSASKADLSFVVPQWIDRVGAPTIGLELIGTEPVSAGGTRLIHLKVSEKSEPPYRLRVPLRAEGTGISLDTFVVLTSAAASLDWTVPSGIASISADPEYHLFRRLYPEEVEPIVSATLGAQKKSLVSYEAGVQFQEAFKTFGANLNEDSLAVLDPGEIESLSKDVAPILLNPSPVPGFFDSRIKVSTDSVTLGGTSYGRTGHTFVLSGREWNGFEKIMVVLTDDAESLPRLGELIPHYGKYSYLVFEGARNVGKGQWEVGASPLRVSMPK
jgi:aminopeptidase N